VFVAPRITSPENLAPEFVEGALRNPHIHPYDITGRGRREAGSCSASRLRVSRTAPLRAVSCR